MDELRAALNDALSGRGRLVMLTGELAIGKTRIAQELASNAQQHGFRVYWGRCYEGLAAPPFWPWLRAIREYIQQAAPDQLRSEMRSRAADIAGIVPDLRAKLPGLGSSSVLRVGR